MRFLSRVSLLLALAAPVAAFADCGVNQVEVSNDDGTTYCRPIQASDVGCPPGYLVASDGNGGFGCVPDPTYTDPTPVTTLAGDVQYTDNFRGFSQGALIVAGLIVGLGVVFHAARLVRSRFKPSVGGGK